MLYRKMLYAVVPSLGVDFGLQGGNPVLVKWSGDSTHVCMNFSSYLVESFSILDYGLLICVNSVYVWACVRLSGWMDMISLLTYLCFLGLWRVLWKKVTDIKPISMDNNGSEKQQYHTHIHYIERTEKRRESKTCKARWLTMTTFRRFCSLAAVHVFRAPEGFAWYERM